jgi:ankyrin repeat protein
MHLRLFLVLLAGVAASASGSPLHDAVKSGDLPKTKQLLDGGSNLELPLQSGETPLLVAALEGRTEIVEFLLSRGAKVLARNDRGFTALHAAAYRGHPATVELIASDDFNVNDADNRFHATPLHLAAEENHSDVAAVLIAKGASLEAKEGNGYTSLTKAVFRSHWDVARLLILSGAACQAPSIMGDWGYKECTKGDWHDD